MKITKNGDGNETTIIVIIIMTVIIGSTKDQLGSRYRVKEMELKEVIEVLKQRVVATSSKQKRYEARTKHYIQSRMSHQNQAKLFGRLKKEKRSNDKRSEIQEVVRTYNEEEKGLK